MKCWPPAVALADALVEADVVESGLAAVAVLEPVLLESAVPVTSTRWPTWLLSSVSRPSNTYVVPFIDAALLPVVPAVAVDPEPDVPDVPDVPDRAFVRM